MKRLTILGLAALAVLVPSAIMASTAQATEGPFWRVCEEKPGGKFEDNKCTIEGAKGKFEKIRVLKNETDAIEGKQTAEYVFKAAPIEVKCKTQKLEKAEIIGSTGANAGTSKEVILFGGCSVTGNGEKCLVSTEKIKTVPVKNTLEFTNQVSKKGEKVLVLFAPVSGAPLLATVDFEPDVGGTCLIKEATIEGSFAGEALEGKEAPVKVEETETEALKNFVNFPAKTIVQSWVEEGGARKEVKPKLTFAGKAASLDGATEVTLKSGAQWGVFTK